MLQLPVLLCTPFFSIYSEEKRLEASMQEKYERKKEAEDEANSYIHTMYYLPGVQDQVKL